MLSQKEKQESDTKLGFEKSLGERREPRGEENQKKGEPVDSCDHLI